MENAEEKSQNIDKFEMDLVNEELESVKQEGLNQKQRLNKMLGNVEKILNNPIEEEEPEIEQKIPPEGEGVILRAQPNKTTKKENTEPFDPQFNLNKNYFYQNINTNEWEEISQFLEKFLQNDDTDEQALKLFFNSHPNIIKGNVPQLQNLINNISQKIKNFNAYETIIKFLLNEYYKPKPSICEAYFFPNINNEKKVVEMLRTCKKTLDIAIFTLTKDSISQAILEAYKRGLKVRLIADDVCSKFIGADIRLLASVGIPTKTDNSPKYHMHNKFAILDNSVIITGSFNWTSQAIKHNQENIFFYEDKEIAQKYTDYFNHLWDTFSTVIDQNEAKKFVEEEEENKKKEEEQKAKEREKKQKEQEKIDKEKEKEKAKKLKEKEKVAKEKEKTKKLKEKEKEKAKKEKEKEKTKKLKEKAKEKAKKEKEKEKKGKKTKTTKTTKTKTTKEKTKRVRGVKSTRKKKKEEVDDEE